METSKVLCFMFLFFILGVNRAQKLAKDNRQLGLFIQVTNRNLMRLCNSCIVYECKTKDVHGRGPSSINLGLFVYSFVDVYRNP